MTAWQFVEELDSSFAEQRPRELQAELDAELEAKGLVARVRTSEGVRRFHLPIGSPIVGGVPDVRPQLVEHARADVASEGETRHLDDALRAWLHWEPAKEIRVAAGELTGSYDDVLSPQLHDAPDDSGFLEEMRLYGAPPPGPDLSDLDEERGRAYGYAQAEAQARALLEALAVAPPQDQEMWRRVNLPLDRQHEFDATLDKGYVDLPLEAVGDSEEFVYRFDHTAVPEHPDYVKPQEDQYDGWYADDATSVPPPSDAELARQRQQEEFHVPVLFRIMPGARALQGSHGYGSEGGRGREPYQEFVTGGRFEVVSDNFEPWETDRWGHTTPGGRRIVTLRQTHTLLPGGEARPSVSLTPLEEFARLGLVDPRLSGQDARLIDFVKERTLSDPRLVQRIDAAVKGARWTPYTRLRFFDSLGRLMGLEGLRYDVDPDEHELARRKLFDALPVEDVPLDTVVFTQPNVNREAVLNKVWRGGDKRREAYVVEQDGVRYLMDGHHGVVADSLLGKTTVQARVLRLDGSGRRIVDLAPNERAYNGYVLRYEKPEMGRESHRILAFDRTGAEVAHLEWTTRQIEDVLVREAHQRRGLATAMYNWGREMRPTPKHSPDRTMAGDSWARAVGGRLPRGSYDASPGLVAAKALSPDVAWRGRIYAWALSVLAELPAPETKARVRTLAGTTKYNLPIGAVIGPGTPLPGKRGTERSLRLDAAPAPDDLRLSAAGQTWWNTNDVEPIRAAAAVELRSGQYDPDDRHAAMAHALLRLVAHAGPTDRVLWRGTGQRASAFKVGRTTQLPLTSFSEDEDEARNFGSTVIRVLPGAHGADVSELTGARAQREWLALGFFAVESVDGDVVTLRPTQGKGVRHVRTPEGAAEFDLPIGAVIVADPKVDLRHGQGQTKSNFRHPLTGHTMGKTEVGDTFEQLFKAKMTKGLNKKYGCCLKLITGAGEGGARNTPLDFSVGKRGGEVKTLSALAKNQKTAIKKEEIGRKLQACEAMGREPLLCVQVVDQAKGTVRVYSFEAFVSKSVTAMEPIGEYRFSPSDFEKAQRAAGHWDKAEARAAAQSTKTAQPGEAYDPPDEEGGVLEPGDTVIELGEHGTPVVYTLAEPGTKGLRHVRTPEGARLYDLPIGATIVADPVPRVALDARTVALEDLASFDEVGPGRVDRKKVASTIWPSAPVHDAVKHEDDQSVRTRLSAAFARGRPKRASIPTDMLWATQGRLSRDSVRKTVENYYPEDAGYRKGYRLKVVRQGGKLYVVDGHHRLEAATLLGEELVEADVVDLDRPNVKVAVALAKLKGPAAAKALRAEAAKAEPQVSEEVRAATDVAGGRLELFDKRLKTEEAITERILRNMASAAARGLDAKLGPAAEGVPDALRYTAVFEEADYVQGSINLMKMMNGLGYTAVFGGWGNSWGPGGTYKGLNLRLVHPDTGQEFELQVHTPASLETKRANHETYVKWRNMPNGPLKAALAKEMVERTKGVEAPQGAQGLGWRGAVWKP